MTDRDALHGISITEMRQFAAVCHYAKMGVLNAIENCPYANVEDIALHAATFALQQAFESDGEIHRLTVENERLTKMVQELMNSTPGAMTKIAQKDRGGADASAVTSTQINHLKGR